MHKTILKLVYMESNRSYVQASIILLFFLIIVSILLILTGPTHVKFFGHDTAFLLDGGWRVLQGLRPHNDFYSGFGPFVFLVVFLGMKITGTTSQALVYGNMFLFILLTLWGWYVARRRMRILNALLFSLLIGSMVVSTHFGHWYKDTTFASLYNRYGWALLSIILIELFLSPKTKLDLIIGGISTGILFALLFFLKVTYFIFFLPLLFIAVLLGRRYPLWFLAVAAGAMSVILSMFFYLDSNFGPMIEEFILIAKIRGPLGFNKRVAFEYVNNLLLLFIIINFMPVARKQPLKYTRLKILFAILAIYISGVFIASFCGLSEMPILAVCAIIVFEYLSQSLSIIKNSHNSAHQLKNKRLLLSFFLLAILYSEVFLPNMASVVYSATWHLMKSGRIAAKQRFIVKPLSDLIILSGESDSYEDVTYVERINEGLSLLDRYRDESSRITVLDCTNPFSFGLLQRSPRGDALWWLLGGNFNERYFPPAQKVFREVTLVMIPKYPELRRTTEALLRIYGFYLDKFFYKKAETPYWIMLSRINQ